MKSKIYSVCSIITAIAASALFFYAFVQWIPALYGLAIVLYCVSAATLTARFSSKNTLVRSLIVGASLSAGIFLATYLIHIVIRHAEEPRVSALIIYCLLFVFFLCLFCVLSNKKQKRSLAAAFAFILCIATVVGEMTLTWLLPIYYRNNFNFNPRVNATPAPTIWQRELVNDADCYVAPDGNDENDGTLLHPFATIDRAKEEVLRIKIESPKPNIVVAIKGGEYKVDSVKFTEEYGGDDECRVTYCAYGDGEVILNGGTTLSRNDFKSVQDAETLSRLSQSAKKNVLCVDLFALGITAEQYGKIYAIGAYNQASKYDGDWVGDLYCELFVNDRRQTIARYPNGDEYLYTGKVVKEGLGAESANTASKDNSDVKNPESDIYKISAKLAKRIASWKTTDGVWMFGYWRYDWADASSPIGEFDYKNKTISPMFVSRFGAIKGAPYYFFNVLEELDCPGEWYLDRESGMLYFWPPEDFTDTSTVDLSLTTKNIIAANVNNVTFDGLTIKCTRSNAITVNGNGNVVKNCLITNVSENALLVSGYDNLVIDNEISRMGKGGITLSGGDRNTLTYGNNRADNNLIHDWSEIYETYQPAVTLQGVGNSCAHNEIYNSPHEAITYSGNDHLIEYNLIHDVNLKTDDGGAIYSGRHWDWYGTVIRYNFIYNLGANGHKPAGIYMDDGLSGQTIYGNFIVNAPNIGIQLGGGRDMIVHDNIVINSETPISYDARGLTGLPGNEGSNFYKHFKPNGDVWEDLWASPWQTEIWQQHYPQYSNYSDDYSNPNTADFALNPAYSVIQHNVLIAASKTIGEINDAVYKYSTVSDNALLEIRKLTKIFEDPKNGNYAILDDAPIDFEIDIPAMNEFGRQ